MRNLLRIMVALFVLTAAACGGSDGDSDETVTAEQDAGDDETSASAEADDADGAGSDADAGGSAPSGDRSASLTLENGESFEFSILCALEPQESAGSEILFTVVSYDDPHNLDVTQFGADSFDGAANISVYDSESYDTVWEASTMIGSEIELVLDGSTVTGSGLFLAGGEFGADAVAGELVANC